MLPKTTNKNDTAHKEKPFLLIYFKGLKIKNLFVLSDGRSPHSHVYHRMHKMHMDLHLGKNLSFFGSWQYFLGGLFGAFF